VKSSAEKPSCATRFRWQVKDEANNFERRACHKAAKADERETKQLAGLSLLPTPQKGQLEPAKKMVRVDRGPGLVVC